MNRTVQIVLAVVVLIILAGGSFYGGMLYGQGQTQSNRQGANRFVGNGNGGYFQGGPGGQGFQGQRGNGQGGGVFGQVSEVGAGFMVVTDQNGTQTKVTVTDTTLMEKNVSVKLTDFAVGDTVIISGSQGSDGTFTARSVQSSPMGRFGGQGGPGGQNPNGQNSGGQNQ